MYIKEATISALIEKYGEPRRKTYSFACTEEEYNRIKSSQKNGRKHDVTLYISKGDKWVVIAKHFYPQGMFRSMSGGINPGEDFVEGSKREALEETGCHIELERFLLMTDVLFYMSDDDTKKIEWQSYVFKAYCTGKQEAFTDTNEIREITLATLDDFERYKQIMLSLDIAGLRYRAALHDEVKQLL